MEFTGDGVMEIPEYLRSNDLLASLSLRRIRDSVRISMLHPDSGEGGGDFVSVLSGDEFLGWMARETGFKILDLCLIAGIDMPDELLSFDKEAGRMIPQVIRRFLSLPESGRQSLLVEARTLANEPRRMFTASKLEIAERPLGFGSLLVQMLALRNLGWSSGSKVMYLMSGTYVSAATIGAIDRGSVELDAQLLSGFSAMLGIPFPVLSSLTGMRVENLDSSRTAEVIDAAQLIWEARYLNETQMRKMLNVEC